MDVRHLTFRRCSRCGSLFLAAQVTAVETGRLYEDETYFTNPDFGSPQSGGYHGYRDYLADRHHIEAKFAGVLAHVERHVEPGRLLDVGAGPGFMVAAATARGWCACGLDLNRWAVERARGEGLDVRLAALGEAGFAGASFDCVTMMDLLEHVSEPGTLVAEAARIVRTGGALAVLTPDAGSPVSRALGGRWPEVQRAPEHMVLFSVAGLAALLARHGFEPVGWHSIGKTSSLATLSADIAPALPAGGAALERAVSALPVADRSVELDPHTKFCLYARLVPAPTRPRHRRPSRPPRLAKRAPAGAPEDTVVVDLVKLARAHRLSAWMYAQFRTRAHGSVIEVGAGIGTFSRLILAGGARRIVLVEPEPGSARELERRLGGDKRVTVLCEQLSETAGLAPERGRNDFVLCQNVLEHIEHDAGAVRAMAATLRPGGAMTLLVPAHPRLFGSLDRAYGHHRRYSRARVRALLADAGLVVEEIRCFNLLGILGWCASNLRGSSDIDARALVVYDLALGLWRPLEERLRPGWGLSLVAHARKPEAA
jgi:FkbM family methyltransferase